MPAYSYRAVNVSGRITQGVMTAANESELAQYLGASRLELIEAREKKQKAAHAPAARFALRRVPPRALALFGSQTSQLLQAGVPLMTALGDLAATMETGDLRDALNDAMRSLEQGSRVTEAFARQASVFPPIFVAILASGEASGDLARAFDQVASYVTGRARMAERLNRALRYPLFLLFVASAVITFMMTLVVPQIVAFLNSMDGHLPMATRVLIALSDAFGAFWWVVGLVVLTAVAAVVVARRVSSRVAQAVDGALLRLPALGLVVEKMMLARFAQCFSILAQSNLSIPESLQGARATLGNRWLEARLDVAAQRIASGYALSEAMKGVFPPFALRVMRVGEQSGNLPKSFADIAAYFEREAADQAERMIGALEPGLTLFVGGVMAWIVLAVLGPIYGSLAAINAVR